MTNSTNNKQSPVAKRKVINSKGPTHADNSISPVQSRSIGASGKTVLIGIMAGVRPGQARAAHDSPCKIKALFRYMRRGGAGAGAGA